MLSLAVETQQLTKKYGEDTIVEDLELQVPDEKIYGFLGPNGAGKTTTLRLLLGLIHPTFGDVKVLGHQMPNDRLHILAQTGALIETPAHYDHLTARDNLEITRRLYGVEDPKQVDRVLDLVGLQRSAHQKVKKYSLGMKQRLGIAYTLMHQPKLMVLDEPTNGLDPEGIQEIRTLVQHLSKQDGISVIVSSHLLNEMEQMADEIGIIHQGHLLFQGQKHDLINKMTMTVIVKTSNQSQTKHLLENQGYTVHWNVQEQEALMVDSQTQDVEHIQRSIQQQGILVNQVTPNVRTLEDAFLQLIKSER